MKKFILYMHIFPNNKKYIGITSKTPNARWENGSGYTKNGQPAMYNAIRKYGWENIKHEIIAYNLSHAEAIKLEKYYIELYKTNCSKYGSKFGYNMTDGGEGTLGHIVSDEAKLKMSKIKIGKYTGSLCYKSKPVITNNHEWETISDFAKENNLCRHTVEKWLYGKSGMPIYWFNCGLRFKNENYNIYVQEKPHKFIVEIDGLQFNSQAEFAKYIGQLPSNVCKWINKDKIPQKYIERGFKRIK